MTSENSIPDPYDAVLADLRSKRDQLDQTIRLLESLRGSLAAPVPSAAPDAASIAKIEHVSEENEGTFLGLTIPEAAKKLLLIRKKALGNAEIAAGLQAGGLVMKSADPVNTIGAVMTRRFLQVGDVVKVGRGVWGLKEWYPNRSFRPTPAKGTNGDTSRDVASEIARHFEPIDDDPQE